MPFFSGCTRIHPLERGWNMPRKRPFAILLDQEEKAKLERLSRQYTSPYCDVMRAKVVLLAAEGLSNKEIGERLGRKEIAQEVVNRGIVASINGTTAWRWLSADAIRPWCYRSWIWPRDPDFEHKAGLVLDLYHGQWQGKPLGPNDYVISADEKTSIQARHRVVKTTAPGPFWAH